MRIPHTQKETGQRHHRRCPVFLNATITAASIHRIRSSHPCFGVWRHYTYPHRPHPIPSQNPQKTAIFAWTL